MGARSSQGQKMLSEEVFEMPTITTNRISATRSDAAAPKTGNTPVDDIVEIQLLLPSRWASDLIERSRESGQSVGTLLRSIIGQALHDGER